MGKNAVVSRFGAAFALAVALVFGCAFAALPGSAYAAGLVAGSYQVLDEMTAPTVSDATSTGAGKLRVTINGYPDADGYEFQFSLNSAFTNPRAELVTTNASSVTKTFTGLKAGKKYYVRARQYGMVDGVLYSTNWSDITFANVGIKPGKSKIAGTWKLVKSSDASENKTIKAYKKYRPKAKHTISFNKKGVVTEIGYTGKKSKAKWVALSKTKGYLLINGERHGSVKIKKSQLILKGPGLTWTLKRIK